MRLVPLILVLAGCPSPPGSCDDLVRDAAEAVRKRWPDAEAARQTPYAAGCVWHSSHGKASVDGFGYTLVTLEDPPGVDDLLDLSTDVEASGDLEQPSLLFFDQTDGPMHDWKLAGFGYHLHYTPCERPGIGCIDPDLLFVHEAGYHHVPIGDGGMTLATEDDLRWGGSLDDCAHVDGTDLEIRRGRLRHGRAWDLHVWLTDAGPEVAIEDPEGRWADAPKRVAVKGEAFFYPECACP